MRPRCSPVGRKKTPQPWQARVTWSRRPGERNESVPLEPHDGQRLPRTIPANRSAAKNARDNQSLRDERAWDSPPWVISEPQSSTRSVGWEVDSGLHDEKVSASIRARSPETNSSQLRGS